MDDFLDQGLHVRAPDVDGIEDLLVRSGDFVDIAGHDDLVGDHREAKDLDPGVVGRDDLGDGGHAEAVPPDGPEELGLGAGLVHGAGDEAVTVGLPDEVVEREGGGSLGNDVLHLPVISVRHGGEPRSESGVALPDKAVLSPHVRDGEVIGYAQDVTDVVIGVEAPGGVGDDAHFHSEAAHDPDGQGAHVDGGDARKEGWLTWAQQAHDPHRKKLWCPT